MTANVIKLLFCLSFIIILYLVFFRDSVVFEIKEIYIKNGILEYKFLFKYRFYFKKMILKKLNNFSENELLKLGINLKKLCDNNSELLSKLYFENELINVLNSKEFMNLLEIKKIEKGKFKEILNAEINKNKKITVEEKIRFINTYLRDKIEISDEIIVEKYNNL